MNDLYKVIFKGELLEGFDRDTLIHNLATISKMEKSKAEKLLLIDKPMALKKGLSRQEAEKLARILTTSGLKIRLKGYENIAEQRISKPEETPQPSQVQALNSAGRKTSDNPYAPPSANLEVKKSGEIVLASRGKRLLAAIIDTLISIAVTLPVMYFTGGWSALMAGQQTPYLYTIKVGLFGIVVFIIIHGKLLQKYGQTVGKRMVGIRIADLDGNLPTIKRHILPRYAFTTILAYIPAVGSFLSLIDCLFIFSKRKQCVHDHVAKTIVVHN